MGHIEKRNGRFRARYRDPLGRQRSRTFTRKADADRFLREQGIEIDRGSWLDPRHAEMALAEWAIDFMALARRLSPTTQDTYQRDLDRYILPRFGSYRLGRMPADEIENWLNDEIEHGIAASSVHRHYRLLRRVLQVAVEKQKIAANPCERVHPPRVPTREMAFLTWGEAIELAEAHTPQFRALIYFAVDTGMRWSELVGLRRARLDIRARKVRVTEQLVLRSNGQFLRKEPKSAAGVRSITIAPFTAALMEDHLSRFSVPGRDGFVFPNSAGSPIMAASFQSYHFGRARKSSGVSCRFHDLRHTSVALAIATGAHPKAIQTRMGHSSIAVTLDRYGHLFPELDDAIATSFGQQFTEATERRAANAVHASFGT